MVCRQEVRRLAQYANLEGFRVKQRVGLVAVVLAICLMANVAVSQTSGTESSETGEKAAQTGLHVANPNTSQFRRWLRTRSPRELGLSISCESIAPDALQAGLLLAMPQIGVLILGRNYGAEDKKGNTKIENLTRIYEVQRFHKSGSPYEGSLIVVLKQDIAENERICLEALTNSEIRWVTVRDAESESEETVDMKVKDVKFSRAGKIEDSGATIPTGETVATITLTEGWWSMAYRKSTEQVWGAILGIIGSVLLMAIGFVGRRVMQNLRKT